MTRRYTEVEYQKLAEEKGMVFDGPQPMKVTIKTGWHCASCGKKFSKSYRTLANAPYKGCTCTGPLTLPHSRYHDLAASLGLTWEPGEFKPRNTKQITHWRDSKGLFDASYYQLAYKMPMWIKERLNRVQVA